MRGNPGEKEKRMSPKEVVLKDPDDKELKKLLKVDAISHIQNLMSTEVAYNDIFYLRFKNRLAELVTSDNKPLRFEDTISALYVAINNTAVNQQSILVLINAIAAMTGNKTYEVVKAVKGALGKRYSWSWFQKIFETTKMLDKYSELHKIKDIEKIYAMKDLPPRKLRVIAQNADAYQERSRSDVIAEIKSETGTKKKTNRGRPQDSIEDRLAKLSDNLEHYLDETKDVHPAVYEAIATLIDTIKNIKRETAA